MCRAILRLFKYLVISKSIYLWCTFNAIFFHTLLHQLYEIVIGSKYRCTASRIVCLTGTYIIENSLNNLTGQFILYYYTTYKRVCKSPSTKITYKILKVYVGRYFYSRLFRFCWCRSERVCPVVTCTTNEASKLNDYPI